MTLQYNIKQNMRQIRRTLIAVCLLSVAIGASAQAPFKRGLEQISFVPKGQWITGISVNYDQSKQDNYQFLIVEGISGDSYSFKVSPMLMYCFKDNLAAGGKFTFSRSQVKLESGSVILDSETTYDVDNLYSITNSYYTTAAFRNYISIGHSSRFGFFNEVQLQIGGGQSKLSDGTGIDLSGTYERNFNMNVGLAPGMLMFLNNYSALEVNVGVLGFSYTHTKATTDQIYIAHRTSQSANFKINLFSITFGVAFYL
jgi:hypothetical protein